MRLAASVVLAMLLAGSVFAQDSRPTTATPPTGKRFEDMTLEEQKAENDKRVAEATVRATPVFVLMGLAAGTLLFSLLPPIIAVARGHNNWLPIGLVSLFFGWTCIGWILCLVWAFSSDTKSMDVRRFGRRYD
jgi:hypothetical protein